MAIGIVRRPGYATLVAKATFRFDPTRDEQAAELAPEPLPLVAARQSSARGAVAGELATPHDLVTARPWVDVLVIGHAYADVGRERIDAALALPGFTRCFATVSGAAERMPLTSGFVCTLDGEIAPPVGPAGPWPTPPVNARLPVEGQSFACPEQRVDRLAADATLEIDGLCAGGGKRRVSLPGLAPWMMVDGELGSERVSLSCDGLILDTDAATIAVTWRAQVPVLRDSTELTRVVCSLENEAAPRPPEVILRDLVRGEFSYAWEESDVKVGALHLTAEEQAQLEVARLETWQSGTEPLLPIESYTAVAATLARGDVDRAEVLRRYDLDEQKWLVEERAWLERIAASAAGGDPSLVLRYGELFVKAKGAPSS
jgi:hypothetical protein